MGSQQRMQFQSNVCLPHQSYTRSTCAFHALLSRAVGSNKVRRGHVCGPASICGHVTSSAACENGPSVAEACTVLWLAVLTRPHLLTSSVKQIAMQVSMSSCNEGSASTQPSKSHLQMSGRLLLQTDNTGPHLLHLLAATACCVCLQVILQAASAEAPGCSPQILGSRLCFLIFPC